MPAPRTTFVNPLLTQISVGYVNGGFIADQVFPKVQVQKEQGTYFVADRENFRTPADARRDGLARANRVTNTLTESTYTLIEKSLETPITDRVMRNYSDPFQPKANATKLVKDKLLLDNEIDLVTSLVAAVTPSDQSGAWSTVSTDIVGTIRTGRSDILKNSGLEANTMIVGKEVHDAILKNTALLDAIKYTSRAVEGNIAQALADFFGVERYLVGKAVKNNAKEGQTDSLGFVWGEYVMLMYVAPSPAVESPSCGYRLVLEGAEYIDEWYEQEIKTTFVRANDFYDNKIVNSSALKVYSNALS